MSCDWHVRCVTCGSTMHFNDANHRVEIIRQIITNRFALKTIALAQADFEWPLECRVDTGYGNVDLDWMVVHADHELRPIDEYGTLDGDCTKRARCSQCDAAHPCRLAYGHDGPCASQNS